MNVHKLDQYIKNSKVLPVIPSKCPGCISSGVTGRGRGRKWRCGPRTEADSKGQKIGGKITVLNKQEFLALNFKLLGQMTGDSINN
jgi:hypothetical protein